MFNYKSYVAMTSRSVFHVIMFISFIAAIKLLPYIQEQAIKYVPWEIAQIPATYLVTYFAALYILPEIGSYIYFKSRE